MPFFPLIATAPVFRLQNWTHTALPGGSKPSLLLGHLASRGKDLSYSQHFALCQPTSPNKLL